MTAAVPREGGRRALRAQRVPDATAPSVPDLGAVFAGRYRLLQPLGRRGTEGHVFRARDDILARDVVLKVFPLEPAADSEPPRRLEGARVLAALDHPSLVTLYDAQLARDGRGYLVTEFIDGPTLRERLDSEGPLPASSAATLVEDLARGLAAVHAVGIVHHHLTSSHIVLRPVRHPNRPFVGILADFGVAHLLAGGAGTTVGDTVAEDEDYLPPEQLRGDVPGAAADIYALGLLAVEALTGESPVLGGEVQHVVLAPLDFDPVIPSRFGYGWEVLLTAMTEPDPDRRPSAAEVAAVAAELREGTESRDGVLDPDAPLESESEPVSALHAVAQSRESATRRRRPPIWAWVRHAR
ncbi:serine/threonine-protein kinase [uncultured Microbacterium sp.]|uniref:serine/threonine-protein kinase n=1 Tax=uncultured Microbacterium sp. TaxID=191216 RepID=UPI002630E415|nr:serine/threonine-protein kinase [uncultured Microbacterium sp.]